LIFAFTLNARFGETFNRIQLRGLDPDKTYKIQEINISPDSRRPNFENGRVYSGDYLMKGGLNIGSAVPLTSTVIEISAQ